MSMLSCYDFIFYLSVLLFAAEIRVTRDCLGIKMSQNTEVRGYIQDDKWSIDKKNMDRHQPTPRTLPESKAGQLRSQGGGI